MRHPRLKKAPWEKKNMEVKIEVAAKDLMQTQSGKPYTCVKINEEWINLRGDHRSKEGQTITISEPQLFKDKKWAYVQEKKETLSKPPEPDSQDPGLPDPIYEPIQGDHKTIAQYITVMNKFYQAIKALEPDNGEARAALINTAMIAWANGKIT